VLLMALPHFLTMPLQKGVRKPSLQALARMLLLQTEVHSIILALYMFRVHSSEKIPHLVRFFNQKYHWQKTLFCFCIIEAE